MDKYQKIQRNILNDFCSDFILSFTDEERAYCVLEDKTIYLNRNDFLYPSYRSLFDFLHEIGHIKTNVKSMRRFEEEYYATEWAIAQCSKYNVKLSCYDKNDFDNYIMGLLHSCKNRKGKNIPDTLTLNWEEVLV